MFAIYLLGAAEMISREEGNELESPYLKDIEMREEQTTKRSSKLNADRQNAPS